MPNRHYEKGVRFERKIIEDLAGNEEKDLPGLGYSVMRSAGSKGSHKLDLVAFHFDLPMMLIQAKEDGKIGKDEWDRVYEVAGWYPASCVPVVAVNGLKGRGVRYYRLDGPRIHYGRVQPFRTYFPCCGECGTNPSENPDGPYRHETHDDHMVVLG